VPRRVQVERDRRAFKQKDIAKLLQVSHGIAAHDLLPCGDVKRTPLPPAKGSKVGHTHTHAHHYELIFGSRGNHHHHSPLRQKKAPQSRRRPPPSQSPPPHHFYHHRRHNHSSEPAAPLLTRPHHLAQRTDRGAHRRPRRTSLWSCLMTLTLTIGSLSNGLRSASTPTDRPSARQVALWWPRATLGQRHRSWCGRSAWQLGTMR
jgi:hypothetical protein